MKQPLPLAQASMEELKGIQGVCLDIDDTLSTDGKLTPQAYSALWDLKNAGFLVVPVTGRPAGWCDLIARFWPVDAVVGENGAFTFFIQDKLRKRLETPGAAPNHAALLEDLGQKILKQFPHARWASDQKYREFDLAIDICEDVAPWPETQVAALLDFCHQLGAHAKLSSIHVNAWFGDYDKCKGLKTWLEAGAPGVLGSVPSWDQWLFIGDSPNDEPLFAAFLRSVGVANLGRYLSRLESPPRWITEKKSGEGFVQMAQALIRARQS